MTLKEEKIKESGLILKKIGTKKSNLIGIQVKSFKSFLDEGIREELKNITPIVGYGGKLELIF